MKQFLCAFLACLSIVQAQQSYDLRSVSDTNGTTSWVPDIQDQGLFGDCWTFASATAMNSNLLKTGLLPAAATPPPIQISSWHLSTANGAPESLVGPNYGGDGNHTWGGFEYQAMGYVSRGQGQWAVPGVSANSTTNITTFGGGPVFNSQNPLNPFPVVFDTSTPANIGNLIPPANQTPAYLVTSVTMYDQGFNNNVPLPTPISPGGSDYIFNLGAADPQVAAVKQAILSKGAVTTSMNANQYSYFHSIPNGNGTYTVNYFNPSLNPNNTDHEVTIIGWNDNYSMTDPNTNVTTTGAWIVQNSWGKNYWNGSNQPNDGTFYAAYNDAAIGRTGVAAFQLSAASTVSPVFLQNELGPLSYANNYIDGQGILGMAQRNETMAASILTPASSGQLTALGLATQIGNVHVTANIFGSWNDGPTNLLSTETFLLDSIGYQVNNLSTPISLPSGTSIVIELVYDTAGAMPVVIGGDGLNGYTTVTGGLSYYWDGTTWKDYAQVGFSAYSGSLDITGGILFVKGITAVPEPETWLLLAFSAVFCGLVRCRGRIFARCGHPPRS